MILHFKFFDIATLVVEYQLTNSLYSRQLYFVKINKRNIVIWFLNDNSLNDKSKCRKLLFQLKPHFSNKVLIQRFVALVAVKG